MENLKNVKDRLLYMQSRLMEGKMLYKAEEAKRFGCSLRSIQRDIDDLRSFFFNQNEYGGINQELIYDKKLNAYKLDPPLRQILTNQETFAVLKILLESRSLSKQELYPILEKLIACCVPRENKKMVTDLIGNEKLHYIEPKHQKVLLDRMWDLAHAVKEQLIINITYNSNFGTTSIVRKLKPVGIMFSEFYFYLTAFIVKDDEQQNAETEKDLYPAIYRIDRIMDLQITDEHFRVPYEKRFEEGEFRKRVQFMYGGKLQKIKFYFRGPSIEAVLDRLPTAKILSHDDEKGYLVQAEVFGEGVKMWLRSQGDWVEEVKD